MADKRVAGVVLTCMLVAKVLCQQQNVNNDNTNNVGNNDNNNFGSLIQEQMQAYQQQMQAFQQQMQEYSRQMQEYSRQVADQWRNNGNAGNVQLPAPPSPPQPPVPLQPPIPIFPGTGTNGNSGNIRPPQPPVFPGGFPGTNTGNFGPNFPFGGSGNQNGNNNGNTAGGTNFPQPGVVTGGNSGNFGPNFPFGSGNRNNVGNCDVPLAACQNHGSAGPMEGFQSCSGVFGRNDILRPVGEIGSSSKSLQQFSKVVSAGAFDVKITPRAGSPTAVISADRAFLPYVIAEVQGNTLVLRFECNKSMRCSGFNTYGLCRINVTIFVGPNALDGITLAGSGPITTTGQFSSSNFDVTLAGSGPIRDYTQIRAQLNVAQSLMANLQGSGRIEVSGQANAATYILAGSGQIDGRNMRAVDVNACQMGSGGMNVWASGTFSADSSGVGSINCAGNPNVIRKCSTGIGRISAAGAA